MKKAGSALWHYSLFGFAFGMAFPLVAYFMTISEQGGELTFANIIKLHEQSNLFYIIDLTPIVVGILFSIIGIGSINKLKYLISIGRLEKKSKK